MQQSDTSSVSSKTSEKKKRRFFPIIKKSSTEIALAFDPRNLENREGREEEKKGSIPRMIHAQDDKNLFLSSRSTEEDSISIRSKEGRVLVQGDRSDLKTQYYAFVRDCNCDNPCPPNKCRHPVYFVYKIKAVYDGRVVNSRESELIRRSERDASTVEIKQENAATDLLMKQIKSTPLGKEVESTFKKIDEGFEGDQGEMSFKRSKKRSRADNDDLDDDLDDENKMMRMNDDDDDVNPNDEVDAGKFSDDSDNDHEIGVDVPEVNDDIWDDDSMEDSDDKNKEKAPEHLSESESDSDSESDDDDDDDDDNDEMDVENGEAEKKQFATILRELFKRNGNRVRINQMNALISNALMSNPELASWYQHCSKQVISVFENLCKKNDQTGFYEFRG